MAALTAVRNTSRQSEGAAIPDRLWMPIEDNVKMYPGGIAVLNAAGFVKAAVAAGSLIAVGVTDVDPVSVSYAVWDNTIAGHSQGGFNVAIRTGVFLFDNKAGDLVVAATRGLPCYIEDDHTVRATAAGTSIAGLVIDINQGPSANQVAVMIFPGVTSLIEG